MQRKKRDHAKLTYRADPIYIPQLLGSSSFGAPEFWELSNIAVCLTDAQHQP